MRLAFITAALVLPMALAATSAEGRGCGRHAMMGGAGRVGFHRAFLPGDADCMDKDRIAERRARRAAHGGFFEIHGRYQH